MTLSCSDRITLDRWRKSAGQVLTLLLAFALPLCSQTLDNLVGAYRASPSAARRQALLNYASSHPKDSNGALALLAAGATEVEQRRLRVRRQSPGARPRPVSRNWPTMRPSTRPRDAWGSRPRRRLSAIFARS